MITFPTDPADHMNPVACYLGPQGMSRFMTHPYASPLFGDFTGLPPLLVQAGDCEVLRDEVTLLAHKATLSGVDVVHEVYEDAVHVFQLYPFLEQSRKAFRGCRKFVLEILPAIQARNKETEKALSRHTSATMFEVFRPEFGLGVNGVSTPMGEAPTVDIPGPVSAPKRTPVSPPPTPTPRRLDGAGTPSESGRSVDDRSTSSSDDAHLGEQVETALEREINGTGTDNEPIVVDAYGTEEPRSRASSMSIARADEGDESVDEDGLSTSSGSSGSPPENASVETNEKASNRTGLFASIPWSFTRSSKPSSQVPTTTNLGFPSSTTPSPQSNSPLAYPSPENTIRTDKPSSSTRPKSRSIDSSTAPQLVIDDPDIAPASSSSACHLGSSRSQHRNHRTPSAFALTPLTRAPPVPETRHSPTMSMFLTLPRVPRHVSSSHISSKPRSRIGNDLDADYDDGDVGTSHGVRERTTSHPDMVKLMREYVQRGPAQTTTTYMHQASPFLYTPSASSPSTNGSGAVNSKSASITRSRGVSLSDAIRKGASGSVHKPKSPAAPFQ